MKASSFYGLLAPSLGALALCLASPGVAFADLRPRVAGHRDWAGAIASLQADLHAQGQFLDVSVEDTATHQAVPCSDYTLQLDNSGTQAFAVESCNPDTNVTRLWLRHRAALFEHGDIVPRPRSLTLTVVQTRTARVASPEGLPAGSDVRCSVAVRPFLRNLETGSQVYLVPGRFQLRTTGTRVQAFVEGPGWRLEAPASTGASLRVSYEVVDTQRGEVVLRENADLACARQSLPMGPGPAVPGAFSDGELGVNDRTQGTTAGANQRLVGSCGGGRAPERVFHLTVPERGTLDLTVDAAYDAMLYLRRGSPNNDALEVGCNDDEGSVYRSHLHRFVDPGEYFIVVDGYGTNQGTFTLSSRFTPDVVQVQGLGLLPGFPAQGRTTGEPNRYRGSCGGGSAPERIFSFTLEQPSQIEAEVEADFSPVLYLRSGSPEGTETGCMAADLGATRLNLQRTLPPGLYYLVLDGYHTSGNFSLSVRAQGAPEPGLTATPGFLNGHTLLQLPLRRPVAGATTGEAATMRGSCGGGNAPEQVYRFDVSAPGTYTFSTRGSFDTLLYVLDASGAERGCNDDTGTVSHSVVTAYLSAGPHYVVVDGFSSHRGTYWLTVVPGPSEDPSLVPTVAPVGPNQPPPPPGAPSPSALYDWRNPSFGVSAGLELAGSGTRLGVLYGPTFSAQLDFALTPVVRLALGAQGTGLYGTCTGSTGPTMSICSAATTTSPAVRVDFSDWRLYIPVGIVLHAADGWFRPFLNLGPSLHWLSTNGAGADLRVGAQLQFGVEAALARPLRLLFAFDAQLVNYSNSLGQVLAPSAGGQLALRAAF